MEPFKPSEEENTIRNHIFDFAYKNALSDAYSQKAYEGECKWLITVNEAENSVRKYINSLISDDSEINDQPSHDKQFMESAYKICNAINEAGKTKNGKYPNRFTFGNAQKLLNMTVKYLYTAYFANEDIKDYFKFCHCPMDSKMLNIAKRNCQDIITDGKELRRSYFDISWSHLTVYHGDAGTPEEICNENVWTAKDMPEKYRNFEKVIRRLCDNNCNPIEYDFLNWE